MQVLNRTMKSVSLLMQLISNINSEKGLPAYFSQTGGRGVKVQKKTRIKIVIIYFFFYHVHVIPIQSLVFFLSCV